MRQTTSGYSATAELAAVGTGEYAGLPKTLLEQAIFMDFIDKDEEDGAHPLKKA